MRLPKELTTVTRLSKFVALVMFITLPIIAFSFGMRYKEYLDTNSSLFMSDVEATEYPCELDVSVCPDNALVGRLPPQCRQFIDCEKASEPLSAIAP